MNGHVVKKQEKEKDIVPVTPAYKQLDENQEASPESKKTRPGQKQPPSARQFTPNAYPSSHPHPHKTKRRNPRLFTLRKIAYICKNKTIYNYTMRKIYILAAAFSLFLQAKADNNAPLWLRHCAISPDGSRVAFCYKGDIFTVPAEGGQATQITSNPAYDYAPVWSTDGKQLAFASDRNGSLNLYIVSALGGTPKRLTTASANELPLAFRDARHLLYLSNVRPSTESIQFPSAQFSQVYEIDTDSLRPRMVTSLPMENISVSRDGKTWLFQDKKGYEDPMRKHEVSSISRDIWQYTPGDGNYLKLTSYKGEDRNPVWAADGESFYYLSEEKGAFNVFKRGTNNSTPTQLTHFEKHPVRYLSAATNGTLCFSYNGELYTMKEGGQPQKLVVRITADEPSQDIIKQIKTGGATDMAVSPNGKEVAFIVRGDIYVTSIDYKTTRQITDTPEQERNIEFSPDGRSLVYSSERGGLWQIYQSSLVKKDEKMFTYATDLKEENLTNTDKVSFQPSYSPDGKEVAYLEDRTAIRIVNLKSKKIRTVMDGKYEYSYSDGDQSFCWSPDSKWILAGYIGTGGWNNQDVALVNADGSGEIHDLTQSGYSDGSPKWVLNGKAMIWQSDRAGYRSHGSWGAESDEYIMFFDKEAYDRFKMSKEDLELLKESENEKKDKGDDKKKEEKRKDPKTEEKVKPLKFDLENIQDRIVRLTVNSSNLGDAVLSKEGDKLYYITSFEGKGELWMHDLKENDTKLLMKNTGYGKLQLGKDGKNLFLFADGQMKKISVDSNKATPISFESFFNYRPGLERSYIFDHIWRQVDEKFYDPELHGVDWKGYYNAYRCFLPYINNNYDFTEMLSEMLGELNASHTGARYYSPGNRLPVASLGVFYDDTFTGDGLKIKEIIKKSPLAVQDQAEVKPGYVIREIDGNVLTPSTDVNALLEGKAGRKVRLTIVNEKGKKPFDVTIAPITRAEESSLLYTRWVERNRTVVDSLSRGRLGYIHIKAMNSDSFRTLYSELLGRYRNKEAVIIDTRHNGGGWLHDDVVTLLGAKEYTRYMPRGKYIGSDPYNKWTKPSCMLVCEDNYSNAHGTPWLYKEMKIGKLIGTPVPGTMTAVWWERQIDPTIVFGIPQVGCMDMHGNYLENHELEPDILIYNDPKDVQQGKDAQLEGAVKEMLKEIGTK